MNNPTSLWEHSDTLIKKYHRRVLFSFMKNGYEIITGFKVAREEVLAALNHFESSGKYLVEIEGKIQKDLKEARSTLLDVQRLYR